MGPELEVTWKAFLLRPEPAQPPRTLEQFRGYTESWLRAAAEEPAAGFRVWSTDEGPPSHSVPPHIVAKAAATLGVEPWRRLHELLLRSYFTDNRDITSPAVLRELWDRAELPVAEIDRWRRPELIDEIVADHQEAIAEGATGVPAARLEGGEGLLVGAQPADVYRRWIERARMIATSLVGVSARP